MAYKLREEEEEMSPSSRLAVDYDIVLTPSGDVNDAVAALQNIDNYGVYVSNMRNKASIEKAIEDYFGPSVPVKRKALEKQRGEAFPVKTKQAIDDLVKSLTSRPTLLSYEVKDNTLVFPKGKNPTKDLTKKIIKTVMDSAGIDYSISEKEVSESIMTKSKLKEIIKSEIRSLLK
jgi:ribosomal protein L23